MHRVYGQGICLFLSLIIICLSHLRMKRHFSPHARFLACAMLVMAWCLRIGPVMAADLPTDLRASLVVVAPGYTAYTAHGHCALRMQCASEGLDYCFTYGLADNCQSYLSFFSGHGMGQFSTAYTSDYLADYARQHRQVCQYELNLSLDEKRNLWALLDSQLDDGGLLPYNYLTTNCSSMCVRIVGQALAPERLYYHTLPPVLNGTYRDFVRHISRRRPWVSFFWLSLLGAEGERQGALEDKLSPQLLVEAWQSASVVDSLGASRPMFASGPQVVVRGDDGSATTLLTPTLCFALLLVAVVILTVMQWRRPLPFMRYVDGALLALHTLCSLLVCYMSFVSSLGGASGNVYAVVFNPLPLLLWLCCRRRSWYGRVYVAYAVVLGCFILLTPVVAAIDVPHALLCGILFARCLGHAVRRYRVAA